MKKRAKKSSLKKNVKKVKETEKKKGKSSSNFVNAEKEKMKKKDEKTEESELEEEIKKVEKKISAEEFREAFFPSVESRPPVLEKMRRQVQEEQVLEESVSSSPLSENSGINYSSRFRTNYGAEVSANSNPEKYQTDSGAKIIRPRRETTQIPEIEIGNLSREMNPWEIKVNDERDSRIKTTITDKRKRLPFESPEEKYKEYELER